MIFLKNVKASDKLGIINLPKKERTELGFEPGTLLEVHLKGKEIWIYQTNHDDKKNQRYVSTKGSITIPAEFRRLLGITEPTPLSLYIDKEKETFILKKD
ncbi:AbrB/MazE/SpoVT family DNA-binding domain-containing protein [Oceanobacillus alkalisoli]|uniref:AbrB/MazE/SpoVT family DNA-binding domain-containing protein n=1 Tax=Oceanobacillus alkalisoli TaxID=2925113 RepID=UPI001EF0A9F4|nr:AbrB/MazE/SpoVT family DNA-binding domain-containing protein [Oceanobacillus alkalisoli]MCF3943093.1 hypothetical protein [Oceanobacillus alkalisoli]MCG5104677.1 hypothetical protein [Oceanobacillus alkalisoli]